MALKNLPKVKHFILTGAVRELNFYLGDIIRTNPGFNLEKLTVLATPKDGVYTEMTILTILYVFVHPGTTETLVEEPEVEKPAKSKNGVNA